MTQRLSSRPKERVPALRSAHAPVSLSFPALPIRSAVSFRPMSMLLTKRSMSLLLFLRTSVFCVSSLPSLTPCPCFTLCLRGPHLRRYPQINVSATSRNVAMDTTSRQTASTAAVKLSSSTPPRQPSTALDSPRQPRQPRQPGLRLGCTDIHAVVAVPYLQVGRTLGMCASVRGGHGVLSLIHI